MNARPVTDAEVVALALRELAAGLNRALAILDARAPLPSASERRAAFTDFTGLTRAEVLQRMRAHGYDRRAFGSMIRHGYILARPEAGPASDNVYDGLTAWRRKDTSS